MLNHYFFMKYIFLVLGNWFHVGHAETHQAVIMAPEKSLGCFASQTRHSPVSAAACVNTSKSSIVFMNTDSRF